MILHLAGLEKENDNFFNLLEEKVPDLRTCKEADIPIVWCS